MGYQISSGAPHHNEIEEVSAEDEGNAGESQQAVEKQFHAAWGEK